MKNLINLIFTLALGFCPCANILIVFCRGALEKKTIWIVQSLIFLLLELSLLIGILTVTAQSDIFKILVLMLVTVLIGACLFSTRLFFRNNDGNAFRYSIAVLLSGLVSGLLMIINIVGIVLSYGVKKIKWTIIPVINIFLTVQLILGSLPGQFIVLILLLNFTSAIFWIVIEKNSLLLSFGSTLFRGNTPSPATQTNTPPAQRKPSPTPSNTNNERVRGNSTSATPVYNKGWRIDDTTNLQVDLLTIEDVIYPVMLKNEHEKSVIDLIVYIRRLKRYTDAEITTSLGYMGLSSYLESFFSKLELDSVRSVFKQSLFLILEDYSEEKDERIKPFLEKRLTVRT